MHVLVAAVWLGAMVYSLFVVQPRAGRFLDDDRRLEGFAATLAAGARYGVLAAVAVLAGSGAVLVADAAASRDTAWWVLVAVKALLLAVALGLFAHVSWRLWPARLFAAADELPALRRRFRVAAYVLTSLVAVEVVLGAALRAG